MQDFSQSGRSTSLTSTISNTLQHIQFLDIPGIPWPQEEQWGHQEAPSSSYWYVEHCGWALVWSQSTERRADPSDIPKVQIQAKPILIYNQLPPSKFILSCKSLQRQYLSGHCDSQNILPTVE